MTLLLGSARGTTSAVFTDTETEGANVFTTGTLDLAALPTSALLTAPAMAPGDAVTAPLQLTNAGTLGLRYALTVMSPGTLGAGLTLRILPVANAGACTSGTNFGAAIYSGALDGAALGNPAQGADAGDRALAAAASEWLCVQVELPIGAATSLQGSTTTAVFTFQAEQTANN